LRSEADELRRERMSRNKERRVAPEGEVLDTGIEIAGEGPALGVRGLFAGPSSDADFGVLCLATNHGRFYFALSQKSFEDLAVASTDAASRLPASSRSVPTSVTLET
jgi:hypothetical protein